MYETKYKHITIRQDLIHTWGIYTKMDIQIGYIEYYPKWKEHVFNALPKTIWSKDCLEDIIDYIKKLNKKG